MLDFGAAAGVMLGGAALFLPAWAWARRSRMAALKSGTAVMQTPHQHTAPQAPVPMPASLPAAQAPAQEGKGMARLAALEKAHEELVAKMEAMAEEARAPDEKLRTMAGQLVAVIRDKNTTFEAALAGLEQLRGRLRSLEEIGELVESREMLDALVDRIDRVRSSQSAEAAALEARIRALESAGGENPFSEISEQLTRLYAQKDDGLAAVLTRLAPFENRLSELEGRAPARETLSRMEEQMAELQKSHGDLQARLAGLKSETGSAAEIAGRLEQIHTRKDAMSVAMLERIEALEQTVAARGPEAALDQMSRRLDALKESHAAAEARIRERLDGLEKPGESPFAEISSQLTRLYAQKDTAVETVLSRLIPLETKLQEIEVALTDMDPQANLNDLNTRIEALSVAGTAAEDRLRGSISRLAEAHGETRSELGALRRETGSISDLGERLERIHAQREEHAKNTADRLARLEQDMATRDPQKMLERFNERFAAMKEAHAAAAEELRGRIAALETPGESPFAEISEQLTRLYSQKDTTMEAVFTRLAPLEKKLVELEQDLHSRDPQVALDHFAGRLDAMKEAYEAGFIAIRKAQEAGLEAVKSASDSRLDAMRETNAAVAGDIKARLEALENPGESPFSEISAQLTRLYAQKDATTGTILERLGPLEKKLADLERGMRARDPEAALDHFSERLDTMKEAWEAGLAAVRENQDTALEALKRSQEAGLASMRQAQDTRIEAIRETHAQTARDVKERLGALENPADSPFAEISEQLTRLYAQKDTTVEAVFARLAPLEAKLDTLEEEMISRDPKAMLDHFAGRLLAMKETYETGLETVREAQDARFEAMRETNAAVAGDIKARLEALENPGDSPFAEISEQLTRLYAQKDATVEAVFARLAPLEEKLSDLRMELDGRDPRAALDQFGERLLAVREAHEAGLESVRREQAAGLERVDERLTEMRETHEAGIRSVREAGEAGLDSVRREQAAGLERVDERLTEMRETHEAGIRSVREAGETGLRSVREANEAGIESLRETQAMALDQVRTAHEIRFDAMRRAHETAETGINARLDDLENPGESPFAEISEQLTRLYAQKDATVETVFARLAPLEEKLGALEQEMVARDPKAVLKWFGDRLKALKEAHVAAEQRTGERLAALENPEVDPFAEITGELARISAEKDASVETVFARLAPLEEKLGQMETGLTAQVEAFNARDEVVSERLEKLRLMAQDTSRYDDLTEQLQKFYADSRADIDAVLAKLTPVEQRLGKLEENPWDPEADEARAQAQAIATQMIAARAAAEHTELFANRLSLLESTLPRLSAAQSVLMQTLEHQGDGAKLAQQVADAIGPKGKKDAATAAITDTSADTPDDQAETGAAPAAAAAEPEKPAETAAQDTSEEAKPAAKPLSLDDDVWDMPQLVSLHRK